MSPILELTVPDTQRPLLVEVPHAGLSLPEDVCVPRDAVLRDADIYVDRLCAQTPATGATLLCAKYSRYLVDLNRSPDDVSATVVPDHPDPRGTHPRGVIWSETTDGRRVLSSLTLADFRERLTRYYYPYHAAIKQQLTQLRERFGHAIVLASHSMPSVGREGHIDTGMRRADVVPGTRGRTTADARVIDLVDQHFRAAGLSVEHDQPYRGGWTTGSYGRPREGWHAIQIELNRALYVNEQTGEPLPGDFERVQRLMTELSAKLASLAL